MTDDLSDSVQVDYAPPDTRRHHSTWGIVAFGIATFPMMVILMITWEIRSAIRSGGTVMVAVNPVAFYLLVCPAAVCAFIALRSRSRKLLPLLAIFLIIVASMGQLYINGRAF